MRSKKILSLEEDLDAMIVAADNPEVREFLETHLQEYKRGDFRPLQIVVLSDASPEGTELQNMFNAWLDTPEQRRLIDNHTLAISIQSAAENLSHVPDCVDLLFIPHSALGLLKEINGAAILFLMVPEGTPLTKKEKNEMRKQFPILFELTQQEIQDIDAYIKPFLTERMKLVLDEYADAKRLALAEEWLLLKIEQLDYAGRGKKEQVRQKLAMISDTGRDNPFQSVKKEIDQRVREFVYHAEIRLEEAWSGSGAVHTQRLIELVATLSELESTVQAKKKVVRLPSGFREKLTGQFQDYLQNYVKEDIQRTLAFIHLTKQVIGEHLERHGLPSDSILRDLNPRMGREDDLVRFSRLNREFEASSSARSTYEILMKIRMMPMMLFMFLAMFGGRGLLQQSSGGTPGFYMPLMVAIMGLAALYVISEFMKEKRDIEARQLDEARKHVQTEIQRLVLEFSRYWSKSLRDEIDRITTQALDHAEYVFQSKQDKSKSEGDEERKNFRFIAEQLNVQDRQIEQVKRSSQIFHRNLDRALQDIQQSLGQMMERTQTTRHDRRN